MPATRRLSRNFLRRRSSQGTLIAKPGLYPISRLTFCPNITPITFASESSEDDPTLDPSSLTTTSDASSPSSALFPPSETPAPPPTRRRLPPGKRRSLGYIPRPPNAFMLFRADFVRQKHVPGSIETNHGSLSKIIGNCWRSLPIEEKRIWEIRARAEKAEHKKKYPEYRFRPVHNKNKKNNTKSSPPTTTSSSAPTTSTSSSLTPSASTSSSSSIESKREAREAYLVNLLMTGHKGDALSLKMREWDDVNHWENGADSSSSSATTKHQQQQQQQQQQIVYPPRRSSSVPLPNDFTSGLGGGIALPTLTSHTSSSHASHASESSSTQNTYPYPHAYSAYSLTRPPSPSPTSVASISRQQRVVLGGRRSSSAQPAFGYSYPYQHPHQNQFQGGAGYYDSAYDPTYFPSYHPQLDYYSPSTSTSSGYSASTTPSTPTSLSLSLRDSRDEDDAALPLPEVDTSLFDPAFLSGGFQGSGADGGACQPTTSAPTCGGAGGAEEEIYGGGYEQEMYYMGGVMSGMGYVHTAHDSIGPLDRVEDVQVIHAPRPQLHPDGNSMSMPMGLVMPMPMPMGLAMGMGYPHRELEHHQGDVNMDDTGAAAPKMSIDVASLNEMNIEEVRVAFGFPSSASSPAPAPAPTASTSHTDAPSDPTNTEPSEPQINDAEAFTDLWKGLSRSGSFVMGIGSELGSELGGMGMGMEGEMVGVGVGVGVGGGW